MLKVRLYAYATDVTSSRRLERRIREDLGFRFLAGSLQLDHWTLNEFRRKHRRALNDVFTRVLEAARALGMGKLGRVAIDSTRVAANASPDRSATVEGLRRRSRRWHQRCDRQDETGGGTPLPEGWRERLEGISAQLEQLAKSGQTRGSQTDPESRCLKKRGGLLPELPGGVGGVGRPLDRGAAGASRDRRQLLVGGEDTGCGAGMRRASASGVGRSRASLRPPDRGGGSEGDRDLGARTG